jgi:hypothetical protein
LLVLNLAAELAAEHGGEQPLGPVQVREQRRQRDLLL